MSNDDSAPVPQRAVDKLRAARAQVKRWQTAEADAKREIMDALKGKGTGTVRGTTVVTVSTSKTSRIDVKALREKEPEIAALYTNTSPTTTLRLVETEAEGDD